MHLINSKSPSMKNGIPTGAPAIVINNIPTITNPIDNSTAKNHPVIFSTIATKGQKTSMLYVSLTYLS